MWPQDLFSLPSCNLSGNTLLLSYYSTLYTLHFTHYVLRSRLNSTTSAASASGCMPLPSNVVTEFIDCSSKPVFNAADSAVMISIVVEDVDVEEDDADA
eukprot:CAMPEP_0204620658 /NCGR_PEP_ID=MMETSP0717-20131115/6627_1 /ASSEMBLY_ACC=CAM_ASM_000666 /TAXON_ID=230516 /ORGANISM="Chaetoceros curvisetus" /LENGTH=98 /DNA_ID=CAMNT_0051634901 /DNA_START=259 /DNA_END=555 /DNA_ORIENTATION=-